MSEVTWDNNKIPYLNGEKVEIPNIKIIDELGQGKNAVVFKGEEDYSNRIVAIKVWVPRNPKFKKPDPKRFYAEVRKMASLNSNKIVKVHYPDITKGNSFYYMVMEYIQGNTLDEWLKDINNNKEFILRKSILDSILTGLNDAHEKGITHGDLHPENIMITKSYDVKILDFSTSLFAKSNKESVFKQNEKLLSTSFKLLHEEKQLNLLDIEKYDDFPQKTTCQAIFSLSEIIRAIENYKEIIKNKQIDSADELELVSAVSLHMVKIPLFNFSNILKELKTLKLSQGSIEQFLGQVYYFSKQYIKDPNISTIRTVPLSLNDKNINLTANKYKNWRKTYIKKIKAFNERVDTKF
ncbi:protein kinase domain-containing protein [Natranaerobius thermophilus]|uniref:Serine/threonine protein kinase n=1 Tax=Natranaerobius thermophilus (strain ATCC BAA-1301 / DSM 18059 / JW/NM-WN-LF) TaxID=457570 RepID=B2A3Y8_NATTJ|nr:protein kinase [Natranaerobius thermophilus]ACB85090.1 serine/threonine protein kinase [Natranaerobius thermophilus JW/NM-WN-LF]